MKRRNVLFRNGKANVAVEFALVSVFFLLPLIGGAVDFVIALPAQAQLNTALQALYYFALNNAGNSNSVSSAYAGDIISKINTASTNQLSMPATQTINGSSVANPVFTYACYTVNGSTPTFTTPSANSAACTGSQTTMTYVNYKVTTTVSLPVPLPGIGSSWTLTASGSVQTN